MDERNTRRPAAPGGDYKIHEGMLTGHGCELIQSVQEIARRLAARPEAFIEWLKQQRPGG